MAGRRLLRRGVMSLPLVVLAALLLLAAWPGPSRAASSAILELKTVPRLPGIGLRLDGVTHRTDSSGTLVIPTFAGTHSVRLLPTTALPGGRTAQPDGWLGERALPQEITLPPGTTVEHVSFIVSRPVTVAVTDHSGRQIPPGEIDRVTLVNSLGQQFVLRSGASSIVLPLNGVVHPRTGYVSVPVRYSVRSVLVQGGEVVHRGSQSFEANAPLPWVIKGLVFPLRIQVRDALFGFAVGRSVVLAPRFGTKRTLELGTGHEVRVESLARGTYDLTAHGPGLGLTSVTTLSRPQAAKVLLFSWVDVGVVLGFALVFLVGLPLLGGRLARRPGSRMVRWRERRVRGGAPADAGERAQAAPPLEGRQSAHSPQRRAS
jgi:hypothetical protein